MRWLILSNNKNDREKIEKVINLRDSTAQTEIHSFSLTDSENWKKNLFTITDCIVMGKKSDLEDKETAALIYSLTGYCTSANIPMITTLPELEKNSIGNSDVIHVFKNSDEIEAEISEKYVNLLKLAKKRQATKSLINAGIPFTVDCFASYITKGKFEICRQFLAAGMDINSRDETGTPMLNVAVRTEKEEIVSWMIDNGAELNVLSADRGYTPVMDAVWRGNYEITKVLIEHGADLNTICKEGQSNLVLAVGASKGDIVELLAKNGADPDIKDAMGMSAYDYAVLFKKAQIIEILTPYHKS